MLTYNTKATVTKDHRLEVHVPTELAEGEYTVVIQVDRKLSPRALREPLTFGSMHLGSVSDDYRREDLYGDDGR